MKCDKLVCKFLQVYLYELYRSDYVQDVLNIQQFNEA